MKYAIEVNQFKKSFGEKIVHKDINFRVHSGECLGLLGGSGMGKSVLLRSLIGLEKPDSGEIIIDGINITAFSENQLVEIRKKVAYVFQGGALFDSMSVYDNLAYPLIEHTKMSRKEVKHRIEETLEELHMEGTEALFPADLSGGMQKRIGLARAIIMRPSIVLYDEPTAGLDPFNTKRIQEIILQLKDKGVSSILVTHDIPTAEAVCDDMIIIENGIVATQIDKEDYHNGSNKHYSEFINGDRK